MYKNYSEPREKYHDKIVDLYFKKGVSITMLSNKFPVSHRTISRWIRIFADENNLELHRMRRSTKPVENPRNPQTDSDNVEQLKAEIKSLRQQLEKEQLRAKLYAKMIEITEKDLNISITKKAGAKR